MAKKTTTPSLREKMIQKLKESDLQKPSDIKKLGFQAFTREQVAKKFPKLKPALAGIKIPYFNCGGKPIKFYRYRYLEDGREKGFSKLAPVEKSRRYSQPTGSENHFYLPPIGGMDWDAISRDPTIHVAITEGEFKAACATKHGIATIGLGGVWSWQKGKELIPDFNEFIWIGRNVTIVYDSDAAGNFNVVQAENALADALTNLQAIPFIARIPKPPKPIKKEGIDDYIVRLGSEALENLIEEASGYEKAKALYQLNEEVVYVREPGLVIVRNDMQHISPQSFVQHAYANRTFVEETKNGPRVKYTAKEWIRWSARSEVQNLTYAPGAPQITDGQFNLWKGWGVEPKKGDITPWIELLDYLFRDSGPDGPEDRKWFEQWLAYPLQHPGAKLFTAVLFWGTRQGTGKSLVGHTMGRIYGKNFVEIRNRHLKGQFNGMVARKQFVQAEEIKCRDKEVADDLKGVITGPDMIVNEKYVPEYALPNLANYYFTSNSANALLFGGDERRWFIHRVRVGPNTDEFYKNYDRWYKAEGAAALFQHFLDLDLTGFNPMAPARMTADKQTMAAESVSPKLAWARGLIDESESTKVFLNHSVPLKLFRFSEIVAMYKDAFPNEPIVSKYLSEALHDAGYELFHGQYKNQQVTINKDGWGVVKLWIIASKDELEKILRYTSKQLRDMFLAERAAYKGAPNIFLPLEKKEPRKF